MAATEGVEVGAGEGDVVGVSASTTGGTNEESMRHCAYTVISPVPDGANVAPSAVPPVAFSNHPSKMKPSLVGAAGNVTVDVAIIGGGFAGLQPAGRRQRSRPIFCRRHWLLARGRERVVHRPSGPAAPEADEPAP